MKYIIKKENNYKNLDILNTKKLKFKKIENKSRFKILYENDIFYMEPLSMFKTYGIKNDYDRNKISLIIDENIEEHKDLLNIVNSIYERLSIYLDMDEKTIISNIKNPLNKSKNNNYILNLVLHDDCEIYNYDNKEKISLEEIKNSKFYVYPIICSPIFLIYNDNCYASYSMYKAYIKIISFNNSEAKSGPVIDYNRVKEALDKLNLGI
jgi:hypothetical protein